MKPKSFMFIAIIAAFMSLISGVAFAMPSDGDLNTSHMKSLTGTSSLPFVEVVLGVGGSGDAVLDRNMEDGRDVEAYFAGGNIYLDPKLPYGYIENRVHLNVFLGASQISLGNVSINEDTTTKVEVDSDTGFAWGIGGKLDLFEAPVLDILVSGQPAMQFFVSGGYRSSNLDVEQVSNLDRNPSQINISTLEVDYEETQATLGLSQRLDNLLKPWFGDFLNVSFVPYVGVQYNEADLDLSGTGTYSALGSGPTRAITTGTGSSDDTVGVVAGLQILGFQDAWSFGIEGRVVTETAVSVNGRIRW